MPLRAIFIDRHNLFMEALCRRIEMDEMLQMQIEATYNSGLKFLEDMDSLNFNILFTELNIPSIDGIQLIDRVKKFKPDLMVCVLSGYKDSKFVKEVFMKGADGYMLKQNSYKEFCSGIREILKGYRHIAKGLQLTPSMQSDVQEDETEGIFEDGFHLKNKLTPREREILKLIVQAKNNKEIGKELFISDQTVGVHRKNIMRKLGVRNSISLIKFAMDHKLV